VLQAARPTAIVPIRAGSTAKQRLAHVLGPDERRDLVRTMFEHVVSVLQACDLRVVALSPRPLATHSTLETWTDTASGLNAALDAAVLRAGPPVLIVHADLPFVTPDDIEQVLDTAGDVVIARARDGGTNALLMRTCIRCAFGASSALAHASRARAAGLRASVIDRPALALDVDDEATLTAASTAWGARRPSA
jgi:2-phospho-L-lactate guanylyltransferase